MRKNPLRTLALASILATGIAGASRAQADDDPRSADTTNRDPAALTPTTPEMRPSDTPAVPTDDDTDVRGDGQVPGTVGSPTDTASANAGTRTLGDTPMSTSTATPMAFDMFDKRWCVGDGPTPVACDVRVVPPGPDAFTMFGETWCLNDAPGRSCDVRVRGDGVTDYDDGEG